MRDANGRIKQTVDSSPAGASVGSRSPAVLRERSSTDYSSRVDRRSGSPQHFDRVVERNVDVIRMLPDAKNIVQPKRTMAPKNTPLPPPRQAIYERLHRSALGRSRTPSPSPSSYMPNADRFQKENGPRAVRMASSNLFERLYRSTPARYAQSAPASRSATPYNRSANNSKPASRQPSPSNSRASAHSEVFTRLASTRSAAHSNLNSSRTGSSYGRPTATQARPTTFAPAPAGRAVSPKMVHPQVVKPERRHAVSPYQDPSFKREPAKPTPKPVEQASLGARPPPSAASPPPAAASPPPAVASRPSAALMDQIMMTPKATVHSGVSEPARATTSTSVAAPAGGAQSELQRMLQMLSVED
jgi:hypothetical protein